jgi:thiol-disulfide isomerase/thioredoxin
MARSRARSLSGALAATLVVLAALAGCIGSPAPSTAAEIHVAAPAEREAVPSLRGELLDGSGTFDLADHAGDLVVVNFWGSWCGPCVAEADDLEQTYLATKDSGVTFVGVNTRDERDKAKAFVVGRATYPSVFDPAGRLALGFSVPPTVLPSTIIIDRRGRVAVVIRRAVLRTELEPIVTQLAAESP